MPTVDEGGLIGSGVPERAEEVKESWDREGGACEIKVGAKGLRIVEQWTEAYDMKINFEKSGIMVLRTRGQQKIELPKRVVEKIPLVTKYKYLGGWVSKDLELSESISYIDRRIT